MRRPTSGLGSHPHVITCVLLTLLLASAVALTGCAHENDADQRASRLGPPDADTAPPQGVSLSFIQLRVDEGTDYAQLRVVNDSAEDLPVTGVGLDWPGYGTFLADYDTVVTAGRVLDLRFALPAPDCTVESPERTPVVGRLRLAGDTEVDDQLDESGTGYVTRIRERACTEQRVADAVSVRYGPGWRIEGTGRRARVVGTVTLLRRGDGDERVSLEEIQGSVLLRPLLAAPVVLAPGQRSATGTVSVVIPRCDEHALTESSATFHFKPTLRFGTDPEPVTVLRILDPASRQVGQRLLEQACVVDGSAE